MTDISQSVGGVNLPGIKTSVAATASTEIGFGKLCRVLTGANITTLSFGDSTAGQTAMAVVADVGGSLDGTYFILEDAAGSVAFWIDVDNSGTLIPAGASAADRAIEITTITTGMVIGAVGTAIYTAVIADSEFAAGSDDTAGGIVVANQGFSTMAQQSAGDSGFTVTFSVLTETVTLPATSISYVFATDDYVYSTHACTFEVIKI